MLHGKRLRDWCGMRDSGYLQDHERTFNIKSHFLGKRVSNKVFTSSKIEKEEAILVLNIAEYLESTQELELNSHTFTYLRCAFFTGDHFKELHLSRGQIIPVNLEDA